MPPTRVQRRRPRREELPSTDSNYSDNLTLAYNELSELKESGQPINIARTALKYQVKESTLRYRLKNGNTSKIEARITQQLLNESQEGVLTEWAAFWGAEGRPITDRRLRLKAQLIAGTERPPSRKWYRSFIKRHPDLKVGRGSGLDPKRAKCFNRANMDSYFDGLKVIVRKFKIKPSNWHNMDEKGGQLGGGRKSGGHKYIYSKSAKSMPRLKSDDLELVTIIECICADGTSLPPGFVFQGVAFYSEWFDEKLAKENLL